jgi:hypothetical protein
MNAVMQQASAIAVMFLVACGGRGLSATSADAQTDTVGDPRVGPDGSTDARGGLVINLDVGGFTGPGRDAAAIDAAISICTCSFAPLPACDDRTLWHLVRFSGAQSHTVGAVCGSSADPPPDGSTPILGYVIFDGQGQVIDNSNFGGSQTQQKQDWLESMAYYRWPCFAGESIPFICVEGYE